MQNLTRVSCAILLLPLLAVVALCSQDNLRFVDQAGKPIADVIVRTSYTAMSPYPVPGGVNEHRSDADGRVLIAHPCGIASGSCCRLVSGLSYTVVGKIGYQISGGGSVGCGFFSNDITITGIGQEYPRLTVVSAANYREPLAGEMIVAAFGMNLATVTEAANLPLPETLGNRRVFLRNSDGEETPAPLLFVSPGQINFILPNQRGLAFRTVIVRDENNQIVSAGFPLVKDFAPGVFTANSDGQGVPAAVIVRVRPGNEQQYEPVARFDEALRRFVPLALDLGPESESIVLALFGTGWRWAGTPAATVKVSGLECPVEYAGRQPTIAGLDQLNVRLPRTLIGKGDVTVEVLFGATPANQVRLNIK